MKIFPIEKIDNTEKPILKLDYNKCNFLELHQLIIDCDWDNVFNSGDIEICTTNFYNIIDEFIRKTTPLKKCYKSNNPPWFNKEIKTLKNKVNKLYKKAISTQSNDIRTDYRRFRSNLNIADSEVNRFNKILNIFGHILKTNLRLMVFRLLCFSIICHQSPS